MKKYIIYIGILVVGLLLGWLFFGNSTNNETPKNQETTHNHDEVSESNQMWTCSMHPQIMLSEPGDCPICGMDLIPAESGAGGLTADQFKLTKNAVALANIETSIVGINTLKESGIKLSGKITADEDKTATQPAHFNGRIEKLYVSSIGERVKKGQAIAQIYSPDLVAAQQELITAYRIRKSQPQLYKAVRNKFKNWKIHGSQLSEIETTGKAKTRFTIYAHVSGVVSEIIVNEGAHIMDGHPIFKVTNLTTVWANFDVYENQISQIKKGQEITIKTNAYPNKEFKANITFINPVLNTATRTVTVRAVLNNKKNEFKPGMFVEGEVKIISSDKSEIVNIPSSAILWTGKRSVVYIKTNPNEPIFEMREVTIGNKLGENYPVLEGLRNGDEIVTNGTFTVDAAAQLHGKKSMMNQKRRETISDHKNHSEMEMSTINKKSKVAIKFQNQLKNVLDDYINLKDVLITNNSKKIMEEAKNLLNNLNLVDMKLLIGNNTLMQQWMKLEKDLKSSANLIAKDPEIKEQRIHFKNLSSSLTKVVKIFGANEKLYSQFCPMADSNTGAYWLSKKEKIVNPYFGGAMLTCGSVKETIE